MKEFLKGMKEIAITKEFIIFVIIVLVMTVISCIGE